MPSSEIHAKLQEFRDAFCAEKATIPGNLDEILRFADEACRSETIDNLSSKFKIALSIFCATLFNLYKIAIFETRRKAMRNAKNEGTAKTRTPIGNKVSREDTIPEEYANCRSPVAMAALTIFCLSNEKSKIRKAMLYAALSGEYKNTKDALKAIRNPKSIDEDGCTEPPAEMIPRIIQSLLECAEIVRDKSPAKLANDIDERMYTKAVEHYSQRRTFKTMYPFEPLKLKYLKGCVGQMFMKVEHDKLVNQHKIDPQRTIKFLLDNVDNAANNTKHAMRKTRSAAVKFDPSKTYNVFIGPINYLTNLMITNYKSKGRVYRIVTYNDCLYDVMGSHLEDFSGEDQKADVQLYNSLGWDERLALLPYRAKIELRSMSGEELNSFQGHAMITVSWIENDLENSKTFEVRSEKRKGQITTSL